MRTMFHPTYRPLFAAVVLAAMLLPAVPSRGDNTATPASTQSSDVRSKASRATAEALGRDVSPFKVDGAPLIVALQEFEKSGQIKLDVRWDALAKAKITRQTPVTVTVDRTAKSCALLAVLRAASKAKDDANEGAPDALTFDIRDEDGAVLITTRRDMFASVASEHRYDLTDLIPAVTPDVVRAAIVRDMVAFVQDSVAFDDWSTRPGEIGGSIRADGTSLVVVQTPRNQRAVAALLEHMRHQKLDKGAAGADANPALRPSTVNLSVRVGSMKLSGQRLDAIVDALRDTSGQNIYVNWPALEAARVTRELPVTTDLTGLPLGQALDKLLADVGGKQAWLGYTLDDDVVTISTQDDLSRNTLTRVYDVRRALRDRATRARDLAALIARLKGIDPLSWRESGGQVGAIRELQGQLIITQTPQAHARIAQELSDIMPLLPLQLREPSQATTKPAD